MKEELLKKVKEKYLKEKTELDILTQNQKNLEKEIDDLKKQKYSESLEREIVSKASEAARAAGIQLIEDLCSKALQEIDPTLSVKVKHSYKNMTPCVDVVLVRKIDGKEIETDPAQEDAGGIADLVALSSFLSLNILNDTNTAPIFLDESTKFVSRDNSVSIADFFKGISKEIDKQLLILTHESDLPLSATDHFVLEKGLDGITNVKHIVN